MSLPRNAAAKEVARICLIRALEYYGFPEILREIVRIKNREKSIESKRFSADSVLESGKQLIEDGNTVIQITSKILAETSCVKGSVFPAALQSSHSKGAVQ